jgi:hypothetical protein
MTPLMLGTVALFMSSGMVAVNNSKTPAVVHGFSGTSVSIDLMVEPLNINLLEPVEIRADLYQKGQTLLAPVQKEIEVAKSSTYEGCSGNATYIFPLIPWQLPIPEVKRETQFVAGLRTKSGDGPWQPSGQIYLTAYPKDFAKTALAAVCKTRQLRLLGGSSRLRAFFKAQQVPFEDAGDGLNALPSNGGPEIYLIESDAAELTDWRASHPHWKGNLVVFCPDAPLLPGVFVTMQNGLNLAKITLPLLDALSSNPRNQKTFLEILETFNNP